MSTGWYRLLSHNKALLSDKFSLRYKLAAERGVMHRERWVQLFETERLIARRLSHQDVPALTAMLSDPEVMKFSVRGVCDEEATRKFVDWCLECYASHGIGPWALCEKESGNFIGFCGVGPELVGDVEEINLGYRLARRFWHQGYAT